MLGGRKKPESGVRSPQSQARRMRFMTGRVFNLTGLAIGLRTAD